MNKISFDNVIAEPKPDKPAHSPEWYEQRRLGIGGSDAAAVDIMRAMAGTYKRAIEIDSRLEGDNG